MLTTDEDGCTALHQAALEGFVDVAELMIKRSEEMRADTKNVRVAVPFIPSKHEMLCV